MAPPVAASSPPWMDLPPDLLGDISGRLHTPTNYVRFHAVCRSWRDSLPPPDRRPAFLPWLVAPSDAAGNRKARCIFSSFKLSPHRAADTEICVRDKILVISTDDGTARSCIKTTSCADSDSSLVDPLTGSAVAIPLPSHPDGIKWWEEPIVGMSCADGTIALCSFQGWQCSFEAALRHPGDTEWTLVQRNNVYVDGGDLRRCSLAYHQGKIILCNWDHWHIVSPEKATADDREWGWMRAEPGKVLVSSHLVESGEELLWLFVQVDGDFCDRHVRGYGVGDTNDLASALSVSVFVLHETDGIKVRWVKRDGWSLSDRVLFLGRPSSFSMDAARFRMSGRGCAYFVDRSEVYGGIWSKSPVFRCRMYNFIDGTCELVEQLPEEWADKRCTWLTPRAAIASAEEIRERLQKHKKEADSQPQFGAHFRIYVGNLPRKVDNYQLRQLFSKHGKIHDVRVIRDRRTGRSRGFGFVTMATASDEEPADAITKLDGQCFWMDVHYE